MNDDGLGHCDPRRLAQPEAPAQGQPCLVHSSLFKITPDKLLSPGQFTDAFHAVHSSAPYTSQLHFCPAPLIAALLRSQLALK